MNEIQRPNQRYIPVQRAFEHLGVGKTRGYRLIAEGLITAKKLGRKTYVDRLSVERMFEALPEMIPASRMRVLTARDPGFIDMTDNLQPVLEIGASVIDELKRGQ